jgi:hypothetical protein
MDFDTEAVCAGRRFRGGPVQNITEFNISIYGKALFLGRVALLPRGCSAACTSSAATGTPQKRERVR